MVPLRPPVAQLRKEKGASKLLGDVSFSPQLRFNLIYRPEAPE
jgi:hypothetical protein